MDRRSAAEHLVVFCTHGITDPLVSSLMLDYLLKLHEQGMRREVLLITEEDGTPPPTAELLERMARAGITWSPLTYRVKGPQWKQRLLNGWRMLVRVRRFLRGRKGVLLGFLAYGGAYAVLLGRLGMGRSVVLCFEPHSAYMLELGIWRRGSLKHRVMVLLERQQMRRADVLVVPTTAVREHVMAAGRKEKPLLQGITIDVAAARFDADARRTLRDQLGFGDHTVLCYVGKFGGIYVDEEGYLRFMERVAEAIPDARFLVITARDRIERIRSCPGFAALAHRTVLLGPVPPEQLHRYLSAADLGVIAVPPAPSQAFRTPVKTAHYWAAGLPLVIPRGVSDDHVICARERVGIVVDDPVTLDPGAFRQAWGTYAAMDRNELRARCIAAAMRYRDTSHMLELLRNVLS